MQEPDPAVERFEDGRGLRWTCVEGARPSLLQQLSPHLPPREGAPLRTLKRSKRRQVYALDTPGCEPMVVKRYPARKRFPESLRDSLRTRARDEFEIGRELWTGGFATPRPLAYAERWHRGRIRESFYVLEELRAAQPLGPWLESRFAAGDGVETKLAWIERAGRVLHRLHGRGVFHRDYHGGNLLLREAEGPQGRLFLIDFPVALRLGFVPRRLRARDFADLLYSLRHVLDRDEEEELRTRLAHEDLDADALGEALGSKRRRARRDRAKRALRSSTQFAVHRRNGWEVVRDRSLEEDDVAGLIADHARAVKDGGEEVLRLGRKSCLSRHRRGERGIVVKEYRGSTGNARRRARAAWMGGVALQVADLPTVQPLALVLGRRGESSWVLAKQFMAGVPLHLYAHRRLETGDNPARVRRVAAAVGELLLALVQAEVVHPDLSLKNLLVRHDEREQPDVVLVDWDGVRPRRSWTERRLARALAQIGDLPELNFGRIDRIRFVRGLLQGLGIPERLRPVLRSASQMLHRRRKLDRFVGGSP